MDLMRAAGFDWTREILDDVVENAVPGGILFAIHSATGIIVATAMGWAKPHEKFPDAHEMGWVAARQEHSGRGLGRLVTAASTAAIIRDGARGIYLLTDDCRLPAIKSYLQVGYLPYYSEEDHACRWQRVFEQLGLRTEDYPATEGRERS